MNKPLIYIVDDDENIRNLVQEFLEEDYVTMGFESGHDAINNFSQAQPEIMLLDILMPEMDGYEVCKAIRELDPDDKTAIIFITGKDSHEERMKCYHVGCDDYLVKPIIFDELAAKLEKVKRYHKKNADLLNQQSMAQTIAFQAMTEASQYGIVLQFIKQTFTTNNTSQLASAVFQTLAQLNLTGSIQFRTGQQTLSFRSSDQTCNPIEEEVFELLKTRGRIFDFQNKTMFNDNHASILIKDMPVADEVLYGRLRDILAAVVEGVESRLMDFNRKHNLLTVMDNIRSTMSTMETQFRKHEVATVDTMEKLMFKMEQGFQFLDLSDEQESFFIGLIEESMQKLVALYMAGKDLDGQFNDICHKLSACLDDK